MEQLQLSYPNYYLIFIALTAIVFALGLYFRDRRIKENKSWLPKVLGILRFLSILGILFLLLAPLLKRFIQEEQKPLLVILKDESSSIQAATDATALEQLGSGLEQIQTQLAEKFEVVNLAFGENLAANQRDTVAPQSTNISTPLEYVSETFEDQNLGAIVLATDGIFNEGKNPLYADLEFSVPIYSIALGDTTIRRDLLIKNVLHNRIVYLNDKFLIEADIQAFNAKGNKSKITLSKEVGGKRIKVDSKPISIDKENYFETFQFELEADQIGNVKYILSLNGINNEVSKVNNSRNIYLEVLDARQKILLLAHAPHPDIKALKSMIKANKNYELDIKYAKEELPLIRPYDVVILHNLPSARHGISGVIEEINRIKKPVFYISGAATNTNAFNAAQEVLTINGGNNSLNEVTPLMAENFDLFTMDESLGPEIKQYVPLKVMFGEYKTSSTAKILLNQKVGNVATKYPLLGYSDLNNHKQAVLAGEGIWRWRLFEHQEYKEYKHSSNVVMKTIQYISQKNDKRQFRTYVSKNTFKENETITFDAQLYNESYEQINTPEAKLQITNADGESFDYTFSKTNNYYYIDAGRFPEGNYRFKGTTNYNGKNLSADGKFSVQSIIKEQYDLTARHDLLYDLSQRFGGSVVYPSEINLLADKLVNNENIKPILYQKAETIPILNLRWLLGILIFLLAIEWFLRRYFGAY